MDQESLKFLVPAIVAVVGWFVAHQFNSYRERISKRRELRIKFLLEAYRQLESAANRPNKTKEQALAFESAVADIQLLGTPEQANATVKFSHQHASSDGAKIDEILQLLRKDLRKEIGLKGEVENAVIFRFIKKP